MDDLVERAVQYINDLDAAIKRVRPDAIVVDKPLTVCDNIKKAGPFGIPEEIVERSEVAINAILDALDGQSRRVRSGSAGKPPQWWSDIRRIAEDQRLPACEAHSPLGNAIAILERHVSDDSLHLAGLAFLISNLDLKIKTRRAVNKFRAPGNPDSNIIIYIFDPDIDDDVDRSIKETIYERIFQGQSCVSFLRAAIEEVEELV